MGLEKFINTKFAYLESKFGMKPYQKYLEILHLPDTMIATEFSTPERKMTAQQIGNWRRVHAKNNEKGVS